jgi:sulfatase-modifying factor enzyme 1
LVIQRIDENTYIDDALVSCADYQLFIDEMLQLGKCYQPDHWSSYHFEEGKADAPILGVRPSDALAYCEWRTKRGNPPWRFRLPTSEEAEQQPISSTTISNLGYWVCGLEGTVVSFFWIGTMPLGANILNLPPEFTRSLKRDINLSIHLAEAFFSELQSVDFRLSALGTLINFVTLQERIAGHSPAFEGIRLVKVAG